MGTLQLPLHLFMFTANAILQSATNLMESSVRALRYICSDIGSEVQTHPTAVGPPPAAASLRIFHTLYKLHTPHTLLLDELPELQWVRETIQKHWRVLEDPAYTYIPAVAPTDRLSRDILLAGPFNTYFSKAIDAVGRSHIPAHLTRHVAYCLHLVDVWLQYFAVTPSEEWVEAALELQHLVGTGQVDVGPIHTKKTGKAPQKAEWDNLDENERARRSAFGQGLLDRMVFALFVPHPAELDDVLSINVHTLPSPSMLSDWLVHAAPYGPGTQEVDVAYSEFLSP